MSVPTAVFLSVTYIIICFFTSFLLQTYGNYRVEVIAGPEMISAALTKTMDFLLISLQDFFVMDKLSNGELIDFRYIGKLILFSVVCRGTPIFLLGAFLYRRRELGVAARQ